MADLSVFFYGLTPTVDAPFYYFQRSNGGSWICTDYSQAKNDLQGVLFKKDFGVSGTGWQWHHVVETNHLKPLYSPRRLAIMAEQFTPCFLVSQREHAYFSTNFHSGEAPWVAFDIPKPAHSNLEGSARLLYINKLRKMYNEVYSGNNRQVLRLIANNYLDFNAKRF